MKPHDKSEFYKFLGSRASKAGRAHGLWADPRDVLEICHYLLSCLIIFFPFDKTARPNPFGMPGMVPPYVPPQMLNIPQTPLQAKPAVRYP